MDERKIEVQMRDGRWREFYRDEYVEALHRQLACMAKAMEHVVMQKAKTERRECDES